MRYDRLFTKLYRCPLLITSRTFDGLENALRNHASAYYETGEKRAGKISGGQKNRRMERTAERLNSDTGLIHMDGIIDKHISEFEMDCYGGYDLRDFDDAIAAAGRDPELRNVMLNVNSPGGSVTGVPESAARVADLATKKNVFAFTDGMMCSAAYYIASQADQIFSTASSDVGSIGVYMALLDASRAMESEGLAVNMIKSGKFKDSGSPFRALTDTERAMFQTDVDKIGAMFRETVKSKRPQVSDETMQGQTFFGDRALEAGLVDAIVPDLDAALAEFSNS